MIRLVLATACAMLLVAAAPATGARQGAKASPNELWREYPLDPTKGQHQRAAESVRPLPMPQQSPMKPPIRVSAPASSVDKGGSAGGRWFLSGLLVGALLALIAIITKLGLRAGSAERARQPSNPVDGSPAEPGAAAATAGLEVVAEGTRRGEDSTDDQHAAASGELSVPADVHERTRGRAVATAAAHEEAMGGEAMGGEVSGTHPRDESGTPTVADGATDSATETAQESPAAALSTGRGRIIIEKAVADASQAHLALSLLCLMPLQGPDPPSDVALRAAQALTTCLGGVESASTIADDERADAFWLVLPGVRARRARAAADEIRQPTADQGPNGDDWSGAVSIAVAGLRQDGTTTEELLESCRRTLDAPTEAEEPPTAGLRPAEATVSESRADVGAVPGTVRAERGHDARVEGTPATRRFKRVPERPSQPPAARQCEVIWRTNGRVGRFVALESGRGDRPVAKSAPVTGSRPPEPTQEARRALDAVIARLLASGWEVQAQGPSWYGRQLVLPAAEPVGPPQT